MIEFVYLTCSGVMLGGLYAGMALGIVILTKSSKIFNFSHGEIAALGAYLIWSFAIQFTLPIYLIAIFSLATCFLLALTIERLVLRPLIGQPLLSIILVTLGLGQFFSGLLTLIWPGTGRKFPEFMPTGSFNFFGINIATDRVLACLISVAVFVIFMLFFKYTRVGLAMRATSEDPQLSQSRGIRVTKMFRDSWFIAILVASIIGLLLGSLVGVDKSAIEQFTIKAFVVVILGGLESIGGALIGGFILGLTESYVCGYLDPFVGGGLSELVPFAIMLLALVLKPYGLYGYVRIERI